MFCKTIERSLPDLVSESQVWCFSIVFESKFRKSIFVGNNVQRLTEFNISKITKQIGNIFTIWNECFSIFVRICKWTLLRTQHQSTSRNNTFAVLQLIVSLYKRNCKIKFQKYFETAFGAYLTSIKFMYVEARLQWYFWKTWIKYSLTV